MSGTGGKRTHFRWVICALLFFATTINYMDRQVMGLLKPTLMTDLHWTESDFGDIVAAFSLFYAFGYVGIGRIMDKVGVRKGLPVAVAGWSLFGMLHAFMSSVMGFKVARAGLGITEGGNFPASIKTVSEWFPAKERALATGIFNAGSNVGGRGGTDSRAGDCGILGMAPGIFHHRLDRVYLGGILVVTVPQA